MPSDAWSAVHVPLTEAPVLGRSLLQRWPMVHGPVTVGGVSRIVVHCTASWVDGGRCACHLSPAHGHLSGDRSVTARGLSSRYVCAHTSIGSLGRFCQATDLSSAMRDPPFAGRVAGIGLNHCFCHNHNKSKRSIVRVLLTKDPLGSPTPPEISVVICRNEAPLLL